MKSNRCASPARRALFVGLVACGAILLPTVVRAQEASKGEGAPSRARTTIDFLAGAATAFGAHESGHLLMDVIFDADPGVKRVEFHGIPFFAITHRPDVSRRERFAIASAGFWVQHATSEVILTKTPRLRQQRAPFRKGMLAFNVLASVAYAGAAFAETGPAERDTRGMAEASRIQEPWIGAMILVPAALDTIRYLDPDARWAVWASRAAKIGLVLLVVR